MKKLLLCMVFAFCMAAGANAYAEGAVYNDTDNTVSVSNKTNIQTVLITDTEGSVGTGNIFYLDQAASSPLDAALGFVMKESAADGRYFMKLYNGETTETLSFTIGQVAVADKELLRLDNYIEKADGWYSVAFVTSNDLYVEDYNIVKFEFTENGVTRYLGYPLANLESSTAFSLGDNEKRFFGVQLNGNTANYGIVSAAYLSDDILEGGGNP